MIYHNDNIWIDTSRADKKRRVMQFERGGWKRAWGAHDGIAEYAAIIPEGFCGWSCHIWGIPANGDVVWEKYRKQGERL